MRKDILHRFVLDKSNIRGEWVHLDDSWQPLLERANYPDNVRALLGEALAAVALLSATVKHQGSLILQIRGDGPVHLLVVQATPQGTVRGLARWSSEPEGSGLHDLFGTGHIAITMESTKNSERYQGIIALEGNSLAQALEAYFQRSEQLPTRLWLTASEHACAGMLLQRLPDGSDKALRQQEAQTDEHMDEHTDDHHNEDWNRVSILLDTLTNQELLDIPAEELIYRLFHEEEPRLFDPKPLRFYCGCSLQKIEQVLQSMGQKETLSILDEHGSVEVTCEFCNAHYELDRVDAARLFTDSGSPIDSTRHTIH